MLHYNPDIYSPINVTPFFVYIFLLSLLHSILDIFLLLMLDPNLDIYFISLINVTLHLPS